MTSLPVSVGKPIGVFDSGIGGITILKAISQVQPYESLLYLADQAHVPYGARSLEQIREFSQEITRYLLTQGAKLIVVACNTASAAALHYLREIFPQTLFVGMEPAVKPAAETTRSGVVGVLATPATFQGALYASVIERFTQGVTVLQDTCPGLVAQIENGHLDTPETRLILEKAIHPMLKAGIDTIVQGCTHYPFITPLIQEIAGPQVRVIDPSPAIARQVSRLIDSHNMRTEQAKPSEGYGNNANLGKVHFLTSGDPVRLKAMLPRLWGQSAEVEKITWKSGKLGNS
jgi:glutamate racemase